LEIIIFLEAIFIMIQFKKKQNPNCDAFYAVRERHQKEKYSKNLRPLDCNYLISLKSFLLSFK